MAAEQGSAHRARKPLYSLTSAARTLGERPSGLERLLAQACNLAATKRHLTLVVEGYFGKGKTLTCLSLYEVMVAQGIDALFTVSPSQMRLCQVCFWDDYAQNFYKRDFATKANKSMMKAYQGIRELIPLLIITVPDLGDLDLDIRTKAVVCELLKPGLLVVPGYVVELPPPSLATCRRFLPVTTAKRQRLLDAALREFGSDV